MLLAVTVCHDHAGFTPNTIPRQGKQPPEATLFLDKSIADTTVLHALALLQRPAPTGQPQAQSLSTDAQLQPDAAHQQPPTDVTAGALDQSDDGVQSSTSAHLPGVAVKTDDTTPPAMTADGSSAPAAMLNSTVQTTGMAVPDTPAAPQKAQQSSLHNQSSSGDAQSRNICVCCLSHDGCDKPGHQASME